RPTSLLLRPSLPHPPRTSTRHIRSVQTNASLLAQHSRTSPAFVAISGTFAVLLSFALSFTSPPSFAPFAPLPLRSFTATMGALTPACRSALRLLQTQA